MTGSFHAGGSGNTIAPSVVLGGSLGDAINAIGSIDLVSNDLETVVEEIETHPVDETGAFDFPVDTGSNNVFLVLNEEGATNFEKFVAFLVVEDGGSILEEIPVGASVSTIDFGTVDVVGENATSEFAFSQFDDYFSLDQDELGQIASLDDYLRTLKNIYINTFDDGTSVRLSYFTYGFYVDYSAIENQWSPMEAIEYQAAGAPRFEFRLDGEISFDSLINETNVIELFPPSEVITVDQTMSPTRPFTTVDDGLIDDFSRDIQVTNGERHTFRGYFYIREPDGADIALSPHLNYAGWPEGDWRFEINGAPRAYFDLAATDPVLPDGRPKGLVPSLRIDTAADGRITQARVRWYYYDATVDDYELITNTDELGQLIEWFGFGCVDGNGLTTYENVSQAAADEMADRGHFEEGFDNFDQLGFVATPSDFQETWYFGVETEEFLVPTTIKVQFRMYGLTYGYIFYAYADL